MLWRCRDRLIDLTRPLVMGILNVTPDSFSDGGRYADLARALERAERIAAEGAAIIDIGGESTRPGALPVEAPVELERVIPIVEAIAGKLDIAISIDTAILAASRDPGYIQAWLFAVGAALLIAALPLITRVPEHRGSW